MTDFIDTTFAWVWEYALPSECVSLIEFHVVCTDNTNHYVGIWGHLSPTGVSFFEERILPNSNYSVITGCRLERLRAVIERYAQILPEDYPMVEVIQCIECRCIEGML